jgi:hypothetical protein
MDSLHRRALDVSFAAIETSFAAAITIAARTPMLFSSLSPTTRKATDSVEAHRMVMEKMEAVVEGAAAAQVAMMTLWGRMLFGSVTGPTALAHALADVAHAATQPADRRVRANARRLVANAAGFGA